MTKTLRAAQKRREAAAKRKLATISGKINALIEWVQAECLSTNDEENLLYCLQDAFTSIKEADNYTTYL